MGHSQTALPPKTPNLTCVTALDLAYFIYQTKQISFRKVATQRFCDEGVRSFHSVPGTPLDVVCLGQEELGQLPYCAPR